MAEKKEPTTQQLFWVWRNSWFAERKSKAQWIYDLVKSERHNKKFTLELLEDIVAQSENAFKSEAIFIAQAHGEDSLAEAFRKYGSPCGFTDHLNSCEGCRKLWQLRYDYNKDKHSDKQPY